MKQDYAVLERDTTDSMKGILAIIIMIHHISFYVKDMPDLFKLIWYIAFPIVGVFFFFSGYGLYIGMKKQGYWNYFFYKRFYRVLLPYLMVATTWTIIEVMRGGGYKPLQIIKKAFTIDTITPMWYVWVIFVAYIVFYFVFKNLPKKMSIVVFDFIVLVYCVLSALVNPREEMYASIIGLCAGVHFADNSEKIIDYINKKHIVSTLCFGVSFLLFFTFRLLISKMGFENRVCQTLLRNIVSLLFIGFVLCIICKVKIKSGITRRLGGISYEIYLIHPFVLYTINERYADISAFNYNFLVIVGTIVITIALSVALKTICVWIFKITVSRHRDKRKEGNNNVRT